MAQGTSLPPGAAWFLSAELFVWVGAVIGLWIFNVGLTGWLAARKGRNDDLWAFRAIFFGPIALLAILLKARKAGPPETEVDLTASIPVHVRLRSDSELELDVDGRPASLRGELAARVNGQPSFRLAGSAAWRWSDGSTMSDEDRAQLRREIPQVGKRDGWILTLDAAE